MGGAVAVAWSAQPGACYSLWLRPVPGMSWTRVGSGLCAAPGQRALAFEIPAQALAGAAWVRVARDYP